MKRNNKTNDSMRLNNNNRAEFVGKQDDNQISKQLFLFSMAIVSFLLLSFSANTNVSANKEIPVNPSVMEIPDSIQVIIDKSCYGCHSSDSKNFKGKMKLNFDKLNDVKMHKLIAKLTDIAEEVKNDDMPPKKAIKKHPEIALSDVQKNTLASWASETAAKLAE